MTAIGILFALVNAPVDKPEPRYELTFRKADEDAGEVRRGKDRTVFVLTSKSGIGDVTIAQKEGKWATQVVLRFQYRKERGFTMLESFHFKTDRFLVSGAKSESDKMELYYYDSDGKQGKVAGHLKVQVKERDGALEVLLPENLLSGAREVKISWIDAFRR